MFFGQYPESGLDPVVLLEQQFDAALKRFRLNLHVNVSLCTSRKILNTLVREDITFIF